MSSIAFIIPTFNSAKTIIACLESLKNQGYPDKIEIIIVDNGSSDQTLTLVKAYTQNIYSLPKAKISALRNFAVQQTKAEIICFIDSDCEINKNWLTSALDLLSADTNLAAVGAQRLVSAQKTFIGRLLNLDHTQAKHNQAVGWLVSAALAVRREAFLQVHGFDEKLVTCEDVDLGYRLIKAGYRLISSDNLAPLHHGDPPDMIGLLRKERWRAQDSLVLLSKNPFHFREIITNLYQFWFYFTALAFIYAVSKNNRELLIFFSLAFLTPPILQTFLTFLKIKNSSNIFALFIFNFLYYLARSLALPRSIYRVLQYYLA